MRRIFTLLFVLVSINLSARQKKSFVVGGDWSKSHPVKFLDNGWLQNMATQLQIGRSFMHHDCN